MTRYMIQHYVKLTEFLGRVLGPDFEVALHDVKDETNSIIAISNGQISGRTIGAPLPANAMQIITDRSHESTDYRINFSGIATSGNKMLRSSAFFIKDDEGKLAGLLCINFDDSRYRDISERVLKLRPPNAFAEVHFVYNKERTKYQAIPQNDGDNFRGSIASLIESAISQIMGRDSVPANRLTLTEKMKIVGILEEKGVFLLKGAVKMVAQRLQCSQASVYRYLGRVSGGKKGPAA